jgi:hypothetical protein
VLCLPTWAELIGDRWCEQCHALCGTFDICYPAVSLFLSSVCALRRVCRVWLKYRRSQLGGAEFGSPFCQRSAQCLPTGRGLDGGGATTTEPTKPNQRTNRIKTSWSLLVNTCLWPASQAGQGGGPRGGRPREGPGRGLPWPPWGGGGLAVWEAGALALRTGGQRGAKGAKGLWPFSRSCPPFWPSVALWRAPPMEWGAKGAKGAKALGTSDGAMWCVLSQSSFGPWCKGPKLTRCNPMQLGARGAVLSFLGWSFLSKRNTGVAHVF